MYSIHFIHKTIIINVTNPINLVIIFLIPFNVTAFAKNTIKIKYSNGAKFYLLQTFVFLVEFYVCGILLSSSSVFVSFKIHSLSIHNVIFCDVSKLNKILTEDVTFIKRTVLVKYGAFFV